MDTKKSQSVVFSLAVILVFVKASVMYAYTGTFGPITFTGPITHASVTFGLYLPPGYDAQQGSYPVAYFLHGAGGTWDSDYPPIVAQYESALAAGVIGPMIMVFPDGLGMTMWGDSKDGTKPAETNVIREEIPYMDTHYPTIASPLSRVMMGASMGGFGSLEYAFKFPDSFCCCVAYFPAIDDDYKSCNADHPGMGYDDSSYFCLFSPWVNLQKNADKIRQKIAIRQLIGTADGLLPYNQSMRDSLTKLNIPDDYHEMPGVGHDIYGTLAYEGNGSFAFIAAHIIDTCINNVLLS